MNLNNADWTDNLPLILLAIRNTVKEDLQSTPAEVVFGSALTLPGQYFNHETDISPTTTFVTELKHKMSLLNFAPTRKTEKQTYIPNDLHTCKYIFIRNDAVKKPLCPIIQDHVKFWTGMKNILLL